MFWRKKPKPAPEPVLSDLELAILEIGRLRPPLRSCEYGLYHRLVCGSLEIWIGPYGAGARIDHESVDLSESETKLIIATITSRIDEEKKEKQSSLRSKIAELPLELQKANEQKLLTELAKCRARIKASEGA